MQHENWLEIHNTYARDLQSIAQRENLARLVTARRNWPFNAFRLIPALVLALLVL